MGAPEGEDGRSADEGPQHRVTIARPFALGRYAVTFEEYDAFCATGRDEPADRGWGRGRRPVINVSWNDAVAYCAWLSEQTGQAYRLPSEAEWEYACRAGTATPFHFGATISTVQANYNGNYAYASGAKGEYRERTVAVGSLPANRWGLHEVHGNVWEWCEDCWNDSYQGAPTDGTAWRHGDCQWRVLRGGSWNNNPRDARAANRYVSTPENRTYYYGFRLARTLSP
jgi:formylglycine-generating enzyme required for sulfatase activity